MLTLPDYIEKKILLISENKDFPNDLRYLNNNIRLYKDTKFINQLSLHLIFCIFIIGDTTITTRLIKEAKSHGICIFLLDESFKCYCGMMSQAEGNYLLRQKQYKISPEEELFISKKIVSNKIVNQSKILKYYEKLSPSYKITQVIEKVTNAKDLNELLGIEGLFAKEYFRLLFSDFDWYRRAPRTKEDVNNLLLDIGYTFLFNYVDTLLNLFGFDTYKGVYHQLFFQRKSLSCDIMEPFRPLIEKGLCKAYNLNQVNEADFMFSNGQYSFKQYELRRKYLNIWTSVIVEAKEALYTYVLNYYRYISNPDKYKFPEFVIR